ncbi:MAG: hypothetical protein COA69_11700 [Robiginitomaculum sp.]|nr:MAG: hypothetical protein COA69_11700 [Robiginitomaculum sp.]
MINKLLFPILLIVGVILGGVTADFLRSGDSSSGGEAHASTKSDGHGKKADKGHGKKSDNGHGKKKKKKKKKGGHGADDEGSSSQATIYLKFKRQFVVPVVRNGRIESLVLLNLNLELNRNASEGIYSLEPKLRDALMRALLGLSHRGVFTGDLTRADTYEQLQIELLKATREVAENGIENVLILDLSRQEQ